ncbi:MAG TPA: hypothetical protein VNM14_01800 [Planctomycetota bacterium]|nr:hypothetical protein [Planctomycetota bacterium]
MGWQAGEIFKCPNLECGCELTLTRASRKERGTILPTCCCCGGLMELLVPRA